MNDQDKTREELIAGNDALRRRITELEASRPIAGDRNGPCRLNDPQWHSLVANTPVFILILDRNQCICFANHAESGAMPDRIIGKNLCEFCQPENRDAVRACVDRVLRTGEPGMREGPGLRSDDQERWYASYFGPIFENGKVVAVSVVSINVTDRKQAEHALRESERRLSTLMSNLPGMAYRCRNDPRWTMEFVSDGCLPLLGYDAPQMTGDQAVHLGSLIHPDDRQSVWEQVQQANAERRRFQLTYRIRTAQAEERWVWEQGVGVFSDGGEIVALEGFITDVTDRKRAEQALQNAHDELERRVEERTAELSKSNEQLTIFRMFVEASSQGCGMADVNDRITYWNPALCRLSGEDKPENAVGKHLSAYYPAEYLEKRRKEILPSVLRDGSWQGELPIHSLQGKVTPTLQTTFLIRDEKGNPVRCAVAITDITERKLAQEALSKSEDRFRAFVTASSDVVFNMNPDWSEMRQLRGREFISDTNSSSRAWLGKYIPPDDQPRMLAIINESVRTKSVCELEHRVFRVDGSVGWAFSRAVPLLDASGEIVEWFGAASDITERKQAEDALRQSHDELRAIYDHMADGIVIVDSETSIPIRVNAALSRMLGHSEEELKTLTIGQVHPPEVMPKVREYIQEVARGKVVRVENIPFLRRDGSVIYTDVVTSQIPYNGRICRINFVHDVTDRKRAEEVLAREHRTLKHLLQSSDHERQIIAYEIHDGLAQQLAAAIMQFDAFEHLKQNNPKQAADAYHAGMTMLRQGHFEARRLISGVRPPILDEAGIVAAISHMVNEEKRRSGPKIEYLSKVEFDRLTPILENAIYRIAQEALTNACRHSKSKKVHVELVQQGDRIRIEVQDHGVGFKPEDVGESRFGLEGIRERARLLGGKAVIETQLGHGTRVVVELPVVLRRPEDEPPAEIAE